MASPRRTELDQLGIDGLCDRIINGESQRKICASLGITLAIMGRWIALDPDRSARVREARMQAADAYADMAEDDLEALPARPEPGEVAKARELASHRRWKAAMANPERYAPRQTQKHVGPDDGPIQHAIAIDPKDLEPEQRAALRAALVAMQGGG